MATKVSLLDRLKGMVGLGPWTSHPGTYTGGPIAYTDSGWIPMNWPMNFGQVGYDPLTGGWNSVVYACVMRYAWTISLLPGMHQRKLDNGGVESVTNSALTRIFRRPNEYQDPQDLMLNLIVNLMYDGNAYALALRNDRFEIKELHWLNPRSTRAFVAQDGSVFYSIGGNELIDKIIDPMLVSDERWTVPMRDILHIRMHCPRHPLVGEPPLAAAAGSMMLQGLGSQGLAAYYQNMSRPSGVLQTDLILTPEQVTQLRGRWDEQAKGVGTGGVPILTAGLKWQPSMMGYTAADAQVAESMKAGTADIARVYGVPLALINEMAGSTYANVEQLMRAWMAMGLSSVCNKVELAFDRLFGLDKVANEYTELEMEALLRPEWKLQIEGLARGVQGAIYSPNEARAMMGLPAVEHGDEPRVQSQVVPLSFAAATPAPAAGAMPATPAAPAANDDAPADDKPPEDDAPEESTAKMIQRLRELTGIGHG